MRPIYSMAGGSGSRAMIAANTLVAIAISPGERGCRAVGSDLRVATDDMQFSAYPDITVFCGQPIYLDDREDVLLNPQGIVEVLSPSTRSYDRGVKFERYQQIESVKEYLLIDQERPLVELWRRRESGWSQSIHAGLDAKLVVLSLDVELALVDCYRGILE